MLEVFANLEILSFLMNVILIYIVFARRFEALKMSSMLNQSRSEFMDLTTKYKKCLSDLQEKEMELAQLRKPAPKKKASKKKVSKKKKTAKKKVSKKKTTKRSSKKVSK